MHQERPIRRKPELDKATLFQEQRKLAKVRNRGEHNEADEEYRSDFAVSAPKYGLA